MNARHLIALALLCLPAFAQAAAPVCPAPKLCESLKTTADACEKSADQCPKLVKVMKKLETKRGCVDKKKHPVVAVRLCGNDAMDHVLTVLGHSPNPAAKRYFCSSSYRGTLTRSLAATHDGPVDGEEDMPYYQNWTRCAPLPVAPVPEAKPVAAPRPVAPAEPVPAAAAPAPTPTPAGGQ